MVRHPPTFRGCDLGRADIHAAVDLARIGADDLRAAGCALANASDRPVLPVAVAPQMTISGGKPVSSGVERAPPSAYGPACSTRTLTIRPTSSGAPSKWTSLFWRLRPATRTCRATGWRRPSGSTAAAAGRRAPRSCARATPRWPPGRCLPADRAAPCSRRFFSARGTSSSGAPQAFPAAPRRPPRRRSRSEPRAAASSVFSNCSSVSPQKPTMMSVVRRCPGSPRAASPPGPGTRRPCTAGPCAAARRRRPTGRAGAGARTPTGTRPWPRSAGPTDPTGARSRSAAREMAGTPSAVRIPSIARSSAAMSGRAVEVEPRPSVRARVDVAETRLGRQVVAVRVDVLAQQRHLAVAGGSQRRAPLDAPRRTAGCAPARARTARCSRCRSCRSRR